MCKRAGDHDADHFALGDDGHEQVRKPGVIAAQGAFFAHDLCKEPSVVADALAVHAVCLFERIRRGRGVDRKPLVRVFPDRRRDAQRLKSSGHDRSEQPVSESAADAVGDTVTGRSIGNVPKTHVRIVGQIAHAGNPGPRATRADGDQGAL